MFSQLKSSLSGEIYFNNSPLDESIKRIYATDASEYQEKPQAVIIPKSVSDIVQTIHFAQANKITIIPRAAGTSLAGQVVGNGIIVDISVHFNRIIAHNQEEKWVKVQPGVIRDDLNVFLKPHGLMFGPETSTANRAMIGGMIGNNSCGLHSIIWGTTRDHLLEVKAILSDGSEVVFKDLTSNEYAEKLILSTLEGDIYRKIDQLIQDQANQTAIDAGFPKKIIKRRNTGYALDFLLEMVRNPGVSTFNLASLIAGSEGTLCFITEAKLSLMELPPLHVGMVAIHTNTLKEALEANLVALDYHCAASELVDDFILEFTKTNTEQSKNRFFIEGEPKAILMVEFFAESERELLFTCENLIKALQAKNLGYAFPILLGDDAKKAWEVRKGGLGLLRNLPGDAKPVNLIEDCAVDPKDLPAYIAGVEEILQKNEVKYSMYAHAGAGELHVEPILNLKTESGLKQFRSILHETVLLVKSFGGSLSGEHGDGRLRGEFIPLLMGEKVYDLFKETKSIFDPNGVFNKGKIVDTPPMDKFLRYSLEKPAPLPSTIYDFSKQGGYLRLAEKCSGSGDCRKTEVTGGTMCPSFMATRNERDTTRARANILRQYLTNEATWQVSDQEVKEILDLCLSCKACKSECPSSVDMAKMKGEFTQSYYDKHGIPFRSRLVGHFPKLMKVASFAPGVYNFFVETPFLRKKVNRLVGFHADRTMPKLAHQTLFQWYKRDFTPNLTSKKVYVFCDEFTNYTDTEIGKKMVMLIQKLGYTVEIVENSISGRTYLSKGLIREAQKIAVKNVNTFAQIINENTPLIGIEPSAILTFRDEYLDLVPPELSESAHELASNCFLFEEWFCREMDKKNISKEVFSKQKRVIRLHGHCHQKSLGSLTPTKKALSFPENYSVYLINSGCCGMAGSFGYEKEHYDISMNIGELSLFPSVRKTSETELIVASGTSCRHQIKDGTNRDSKHPIEVLFEALKIVDPPIVSNIWKKD
jgi:FAD/FMN-containing dehydrogenase/Fe-S oxidoreductase